MNHIYRLMRILTTLQSKKYSTAEHLSQTFEISVRTIYRDIQGYSLPPTSFTIAEVNAIILIKTLTKIKAVFDNISFSDYLKNMRSKLRR